MKYLLLIATDPANFAGDKAKALIPDIMARHAALAEELRAAGVEWSGARLQDVGTSRTVRTDGAAQTIHDGPFAETRELLGGFYVVDVPDLETAIGWAKKIPMPGSGSVEVRPYA